MLVCVCVYPPVLGKIRSAVGSAQLLMSQKFQQFYWLCEQNLVSAVRSGRWNHQINLQVITKVLHLYEKLLAQVQHPMLTPPPPESSTLPQSNLVYSSLLSALI